MKLNGRKSQPWGDWLLQLLRPKNILCFTQVQDGLSAIIMASARAEREKPLALTQVLPAMPGPSPTNGCKWNSFRAEPGSGLVSSWKAVQLPGPVMSQGTPAKGAPWEVIYSVRLNPPCSVRGVAVARSTTMSRKGWPQPGSWQWGIKPITDLDVIQSKPPSSWRNLQLRGSYFKVPLGDTALPFSGFILTAKFGCTVPCGPACIFWQAELRLSQWTSKSCHHRKFSFITFKKFYCRSLILL